MVYSARLAPLTRYALPALLAVLAGCADAATDGSGAGRAGLSVVPEYPAGYVTGSLNLVIDRVKVRVIRPPAEWVLDTAATFPASAQSITMRVEVPLKARSERLEAVLELWAGPMLVFAGSRQVEVTQGAAGGAPTTIPLTYRGPGAEARVIEIIPGDTIITPGESLAFRVAADNGRGVQVDEVYVGWSVTGDPEASVSPTGLLSAPPSRGSAILHARAATGARDSIRVWFAPPPTAVIPIGGGAQMALVGRALPTPLAVRVAAADGLGVPGVLVRFSTTDGGQLEPAEVRTDAEGVARTTAILGGQAGPQWFYGTAYGLSPAQFLVEGIADGPTTIAIIRGTDQLTPPGLQVAVPLEVVVTDQFGNGILGTNVRWEVVAGGGLLGSSGAPTVAGGRAFNAYQMGTATVTNLVRATLEATGASVVFVLEAGEQ
jgi:hypothetical protein